MPVSQVVGYIKGKSAIHLARAYGERKPFNEVCVDAGTIFLGSHNRQWNLEDDTEVFGIAPHIYGRVFSSCHSE